MATVDLDCIKTYSAYMSIGGKFRILTVHLKQINY